MVSKGFGEFNGTSIILIPDSIRTSDTLSASKGVIPLKIAINGLLFLKTLNLSILILSNFILYL